MSEWIDVNERMPPFTAQLGDRQSTNNVLVWNEEEYGIAYLVRYKDNARWVELYGDIIKPTHWQSLPAPPEASQSKGDRP